MDGARDVAAQPRRKAGEALPREDLHPAFYRLTLDVMDRRGETSPPRPVASLDEGVRVQLREGVHVDIRVDQGELVVHVGGHGPTGEHVLAVLPRAINDMRVRVGS